MLIALAPAAAAVATAWENSVVDVALSLKPAATGTETSSRWQLEQAAEAMSMSSDVSRAISSSSSLPVRLVCGAGCAPPLKFSSFRQPLAVVQAGRPKVDRYVARSDARVASTPASMIAMVLVLVDVAG